MESPFQGQEELKGKRSKRAPPPSRTSGSVIRFWSMCVCTVLALTHALRYGGPLPEGGGFPIFNVTHWGEGTCDGPRFEMRGTVVGSDPLPDLLPHWLRRLGMDPAALPTGCPLEGGEPSRVLPQGALRAVVVV